MLEAYTDGRLACAQGIMREECPYPDGSPDWLLWREGYDDALAANELGFIGPAPPVRGAPCATSSPKNPKISATADRDVFRRG